MSGGGRAWAIHILITLGVAWAGMTGCPAQSTCSADEDCPSGWVCSPQSGRCMRADATGSSGVVGMGSTSTSGVVGSSLGTSGGGTTSRPGSSSVGRSSTSAPSSLAVTSSSSEQSSSAAVTASSSGSSSSSTGQGSSTLSGSSSTASGSSGVGKVVVEGAFVPGGFSPMGTGVVVEGSFDVTGFADGVTTGGVHLQGRFQ